MMMEGFFRTLNMIFLSFERPLMVEVTHVKHLYLNFARHNMECFGKVAKTVQSF